MSDQIKTVSATSIRVPLAALLLLSKTCLQHPPAVKRMLLIVAIVTASIALALLTS